MSRVELFALSHEAVWTQAADRFEYSPNGKWPHIQRVCFWILRKLNAFAQIGTTEVRRTSLDLNNLVEAVMRNRFDVEALYNRRARYLVIGMDKWAELTNDTTRNYFTFDIPHAVDVRAGRYGSPTPLLFRGLKVIVVPWVDGMFVLPDLEGNV